MSKTGLNPCWQVIDDARLRIRPEAIKLVEVILHLFVEVAFGFRSGALLGHAYKILSGKLPKSTFPALGALSTKPADEVKVEAG
jgi:hypothetical protein